MVAAEIPGRVFIRLTDRKRAPARGCRSFSSFDGTCVSLTGVNTFIQIPPAIRIGGIVEQEPVSIHTAGHGPEDALRVGSEGRSADGAGAGTAGRDIGPSYCESADHGRHRSRQGSRARA